MKVSNETVTLCNPITWKKTKKTRMEIFNDYMKKIEKDEKKGLLTDIVKVWNGTTVTVTWRSIWGN